MKVATRTTTTGLVLVGAASFVVWLRAWRRREVERFRRLALELASVGVVKVRGSTGWRKYLAWKKFVPILERAWREVVPSFDIREPATWPVIERGRAHAFTYKHGGYGVRLWRDHYEAEATASAFAGGAFEKPRVLGEARVLLHGEENSWAITNFPHPTRRGPTPRHAHVDDGRDGRFPKTNPRRGLDVFRDQTIVGLYCCTPGDLTEAAGVTILYPGSHLLILEMLNRRPFAWAALQAALRDGALDELKTQIPISDHEMLLLAGPLVHGASYAEVPMRNGQPRTIMNPKVYVVSGDFDPSSPVAACARDPRSFWIAAGRSRADFDHLLAALDLAIATRERDIPEDEATTTSPRNLEHRAL